MDALTIVGIVLVIFTLVKILTIVISINQVKPPEIDPDRVAKNNKAYDGDDDDWED